MPKFTRDKLIKALTSGLDATHEMEHFEFLTPDQLKLVIELRNSIESVIEQSRNFLEALGEPEARPIPKASNDPLFSWANRDAGLKLEHSDEMKKRKLERKLDRLVRQLERMND